jgi:hypothetical protein
MRHCHRCGSEWTTEKREPGVKETCPACNAYLHCCLNCRHHDPSRNNECRVPNTDAVSRRDGANFCDEFVFFEGARASRDPRKDSALSNFDRLFGNGDDESNAQPDKNDFDKLFGD